MHFCTWGTRLEKAGELRRWLSPHQLFSPCYQQWAHQKSENWYSVLWWGLGLFFKIFWFFPRKQITEYQTNISLMLQKATRGLLDHSFFWALLTRETLSYPIRGHGHRAGGITIRLAPVWVLALSTWENRRRGGKAAATSLKHCPRASLIL